MLNDLKVFSRFCRPHVIASPSGTAECDVFEERVNERGIKYLVVTGKKNLKEFIEASKEETKIDNIIKRFQRTGDINVLNVNQGFYADISNLPSNLLDAHNHLIKLSNTFDKLPSDIKKKFDNSFDKFIHEVSSYDTETFIDMFDLSSSLTPVPGDVNSSLGESINGGDLNES